MEAMQIHATQVISVQDDVTPFIVYGKDHFMLDMLMCKNSIKQQNVWWLASIWHLDSQLLAVIIA